jgi:hypothetical protein
MQIQVSMKLTLAMAQFDEILHLIDAAGVRIFMRLLRLPFCEKAQINKPSSRSNSIFLSNPPA